MLESAPTQIKVFSFIKFWIDEHFGDFEDTAAMERLHSVVERIGANPTGPWSAKSSKYLSALIQKKLNGQGKKMHIFATLHHEDGRALATCEQILIHVDLATRRASDPAPHIAAKLAEIEALHAKLPRPEGIGRHVGQAR